MKLVRNTWKAPSTASERVAGMRKCRHEHGIDYIVISIGSIKLTSEASKHMQNATMKIRVRRVVEDDAKLQERDAEKPIAAAIPTAH